MMANFDKKSEKIRKKLKKLLGDKRYIHSLGTEAKARELAERFNADSNKAALAGLLHDCAKFLKKEEILEYVQKHKIEIPGDNIYSLAVLHCYVGEHMAKIDYEIEDDEILSAIRHHTLGSPNMTLLDKIVYIADKIEDNTRSQNCFQMIRKVLRDTNSLDEAILASYGGTIINLIEKKSYISHDTLSHWNHLLIQTGKIEVV